MSILKVTDIHLMREKSLVGLLWKFWYFLRLSCRIPNHRPSIFCPGDFIKHQHSSRIFKPLKAKIASEFIAVLKSCCNTICIYLFVCKPKNDKHTNLDSEVELLIHDLDQQMLCCLHLHIWVHQYAECLLSIFHKVHQ